MATLVEVPDVMGSPPHANNLILPSETARKMELKPKLHLDKDFDPDPNKFEVGFDKVEHPDISPRPMRPRQRLSTT